MIAMAEAADIAEKKQEKDALRLKNLRLKLFEGLCHEIEGVFLNGSLEGSVTNTLNLGFEAVDGETVLW